MRSIPHVLTAAALLYLLLVPCSCGSVNRHLIRSTNIFDRFRDRLPPTVELGRNGKQKKDKAKKGGKHTSISMAPSPVPSVTPTCFECDDLPNHNLDIEFRLQRNNSLSGSFHFSHNQTIESKSENSNTTDDGGGKDLDRLSNGVVNASREVGVFQQGQDNDYMNGTSEARGLCPYTWRSLVLTFLAHMYYS